MKKKKEQVEIIEKLIKDEQEALDGYHKAIDELKDCCKPCLLEKLGEIYAEEAHHLKELEEVKHKIEDDGVGDDDADKLFGFKILGGE